MYKVSGAWEASLCLVESISVATGWPTHFLLFVFLKAWPLKPHSDVLDAFFDSDKMKALASFQDLYVGLEPYRNSALLGGGVLQSTAPAVFGLLAAIELHPTNPQSGGTYSPDNILDGWTGQWCCSSMDTQASRSIKKKSCCV